MNFTKIVQFFQNENVFCFTSDIDWAPEWAIEEMLNMFSDFAIPLTVFVSHKSQMIARYYQNPENMQNVGLHPNFLPRSSHGDNFPEQIDYCQNLWPSAISYRAHCFFDSSIITQEFSRRNFKYDSNVCLFLQPFCTPLNHFTGIMRFPVYWEDDVHYKKGLSFEFATIKNHLMIPGLKIFNFHPLNLSLNTPDNAYYLNHKFLYQASQYSRWREYIYPGKGEKDFLFELVDFVAKRKVSVASLYELYNQLSSF